MSMTGEELLKLVASGNLINPVSLRKAIASPSSPSSSTAITSNGELIVDYREQVGLRRTLLMVASFKGRFENVSELLKAGANVNLLDKGGSSALILAAQRSQTACINLLLRYRANPNIQDANGFTALMYAATTGRKSCIEALLEANARQDLRNKKRKLAEDLAPDPSIFRSWNEQKERKEKQRTVTPDEGGGRPTLSPLRSSPSTTPNSTPPASARNSPRHSPTAAQKKPPEKRKMNGPQQSTDFTLESDAIKKLRSRLVFLDMCNVKALLDYFSDVRKILMNPPGKNADVAACLKLLLKFCHLVGYLPNYPGYNFQALQSTMLERMEALLNSSNQTIQDMTIEIICPLLLVFRKVYVISPKASSGRKTESKGRLTIDGDAEEMPYRFFLHHLCSKPDYLVTLLDVVDSTFVDALLRIIVFNLFKELPITTSSSEKVDEQKFQENQTERDTSLLSVIDISLQRRFIAAKTKGMDSFLRENSPDSKLLSKYAMRDSQIFLRLLLQKPLELLLNQKGLDLLAMLEKKRLAEVIRACTAFLQTLYDCDLPIGTRRICKILRDLPYIHLSNLSIEKKETMVDSLLGGFLFLRLINPTILEFNKQANPTGKRNIVLVIKILQKLANGASFKETDQHLIQLNGFLQIEMKKVHKFFQKVVAIQPPNLTDTITRETCISISLADLQVLQDMCNKARPKMGLKDSDPFGQALDGMMTLNGKTPKDKTKTYNFKFVGLPGKRLEKPSSGENASQKSGLSGMLGKLFTPGSPPPTQPTNPRLQRRSHSMVDLSQNSEIKMWWHTALKRRKNNEFDLLSEFLVTPYAASLSTIIEIEKTIPKFPLCIIYIIVDSYLFQRTINMEDESDFTAFSTSTPNSRSPPEKKRLMPSEKEKTREKEVAAVTTPTNPTKPKKSRKVTEIPSTDLADFLSDDSQHGDAKIHHRQKKKTTEYLPNSVRPISPVPPPSPGPPSNRTPPRAASIKTQTLPTSKPSTAPSKPPTASPTAAPSRSPQPSPARSPPPPAAASPGKRPPAPSTSRPTLSRPSTIPQRSLSPPPPSRKSPPVSPTRPLSPPPNMPSRSFSPPPTSPPPKSGLKLAVPSPRAPPGPPSPPSPLPDGEELIPSMTESEADCLREEITDLDF